MTNNLAEALQSTADVMEALGCLKLENMDILDQLYFVGAYMKFANDMKPITDKYAGTKEQLEKLKADKAKENATKFTNIIQALAGKRENKDDNSDGDTTSGES